VFIFSYLTPYNDIYLKSNSQMEKTELKKLYESIQYLENNSNDDVISEGIWSKIKYGLSKLGRYKAGGKIIGKNKVTKDAEDKIRNILNKESNKLLRGLDSTIREVSPEFPNDEKGITFLRGILTMGSLYDSIVAGTKKNQDEEGYMPVDAANKIIADLREIVKKYLDVDLAGVYTTMESEEKDGLILTEQEKEMLFEKNWLSRGYDAVKGAKDKAMDSMFGAKKGASKPREKGSRMGAKMDKNSGKQDFETHRMGKDGLESNTLPVLLNLVGGAMGGLSWLTTTEWFKDLFEETTSITDTEEVKEVVQTSVNDTLGSINPGEGMTQILSRTMEGVDLSPSSSPEEFLSAVKEVGGGDVSKGIGLLTQEGGIFTNPEAAKQTLEAIASDPHAHGDTLGEVFKGTWEGTGKAAGDTLVTVQGGTLTGIITKAIVTIVIKNVIKTGVKTGAGYAVAKGLGALLGPIGLGLIAAGATLKVLREKGQRQSRAKTLNDLLQMLQDVEPSNDNPPVIKPEVTEEPPVVDAEFLKGNRNMQLGHLSKNFLPDGQDVWSRLGLKDGVVLPTGFIDAALDQGKSRDENYKKKYLTKYHKHLTKEGSFTKDMNLGAWLAKVHSTDSRAIIQWISSTRKNIGGFLRALKKTFPSFGIGERAEATTSRPGERGKGMGIAGEALNERGNLLVESDLGKQATSAGFDEGSFMKNLPQFMEMLSMMYYSVKNTKLSYNKEAVLSACEDSGCKSGTTKKYERTKSDDYKLKGQDYMSEEIKRIKSLMN
jgi:hypothetical protein